VTVARLIMARLLDLGADESYALAVSRAFQWSFFDHPPMAFWIAGLTQIVFGPEVPPVLFRLPFIVIAGGSMAAMFALTKHFYGERAGLWATGLMATAPFFFLSAGSWVVPDGPLMLALLLAALFFVRALEGRNSAWPSWVGAGLFAGLALLSKYQAIVVILGALIVLAMPAHRHWLRRPQPYVAALIAAVLFAPVVWWNAAYDWVSIGFQLGRGQGGADLSRSLLVLAVEALYLLPWVAVGLVIAAVKVRGPAATLLLPLALPLIVLFNVLMFIGPPGLPHWSMPGWLILFPLLGNLLATPRDRKWPLAFAGVSAATLAAMSVAGILLVSDWRVSPVLNGALAEATSWSGVREGFASADLLDRPNTFLAAMGWLDGARLAEAVRPTGPVAVFGGDPRGFAFLANPNSRLGQDAIIVATPGNAASVEAFAKDHFASVETVGTYETEKGGLPAFSETVWLARNFSKPVPVPYGPWKR
jgi:hypothetical protein